MNENTRTNVNNDNTIDTEKNVKKPLNSHILLSIVNTVDKTLT